jgi:Bacterial Ig-like domain (group 2)
MRISIPSAPPFSSRVYTFTLRSAEGDVAVQWQLSASPVAAVAVSSTDVLLQVKQSEQLASTVQINGTASRAVVWSTSNSRVATVSTAGAATGVSPGLATITATSAVDATKSATALVRVFDPSQQLPFAWRVTDPVRPIIVRRDASGIQSVTLQATAQGTAPPGVAPTIFPNPMSSRVEFWVQRPGSPWRLVSQTSSPPPNNPVPGGGWSFSTVWNPDATNAPFPNPSSNRLTLIAIGITTNFAVYPTPTDTSITVTVP